MWKVLIEEKRDEHLFAIKAAMILSQKLSVSTLNIIKIFLKLFESFSPCLGK